MGERRRTTEAGAALVTVLLLLVALTVLGIAGLATARLDTRIVTSTLGPTTARARAEEGLAWGESSLRRTANWDLLLDPAGWAPLATLDPTMQVSVRDDDDLDGDPGRDTNGVVILRSVGLVGAVGERDASQVVVEAGMRREGFSTYYPQAGGAANTGTGH
ncbi:MAG: hypothetical protein GW783_07180 [Deltaproteobacteria bacterium]|nr:hypothetical protein [Deltaproteobacteria bacterium]NCS73891.1 hypothetical protein [Deltaproteobacteria bacterium]